jgi:predicted Fe-Mo cluster-binding NifX family protein
MRIAITAQGRDLDTKVDPRFGRTSQFLLVETETMKYEVIGNSQSLDLPQGAGIQAAQNILRHHPNAILTGNCGPKAFKVLGAAGVDVILGVSGTAREAVQSFLAGQYDPAKDANVEGHW